MKQLTYFLIILLFLSCSKTVEKSGEDLSDNKYQWVIDNFPNIEKVPRHRVMTLGVFHFDRNRDGSDVVASNHIDISSDVNQDELDRIIENLKTFNPSRIAVEWRTRYQDRLDSLYQAYKTNKVSLGKNEAFQIGFKLAKMLGHEKVYCIDNNPPLPDNINEIDDWEAYADSLGHLSLWRSYDRENQRYNYFMDTIQNQLNVTDYLMLINSEENIIRTKQLWTTGLVNVGHGDKYLGPDLLGRWYRRNSRIYANAKNLVEQGSNENLLIIYGGAHKWILDELFESSPDFEVVQFNDLMGG